MSVVPVAVHAHEPLPASLRNSSNQKTFLSKLFLCGCFTSHKQQQHRTVASRPVTPILTDQEQQRSEEKTIGRELFCPICMYYTSQVLTMHCCGHSVCFVCASEYYACHGLRFSLIDSSVMQPALACMHCARPSFQAVCISHGGRVYEDSPSVVKMQLRQHNRLVMSGSGSITLPSPLKRGDGFEALAAKLISYEQHSNMLMTLPDTPTLNSINCDPSTSSSDGRVSPLTVPTLEPAPCARASARAGSLAEGLGGRSRPSSALSLSSSSGSGVAGGSRPPSGPSRTLRPVTPASSDTVALAPLTPVDINVATSSEADAASAALAAAFVMAAGGNDDVRASVSMVDPILADMQLPDMQQQEIAEFCVIEALDSEERGPTLNVPLS